MVALFFWVLAISASISAIRRCASDIPSPFLPPLFPPLSFGPPPLNPRTKDNHLASRTPHSPTFGHAAPDPTGNSPPSTRETRKESRIRKRRSGDKRVSLFGIPALSFHTAIPAIPLTESALGGG
eukprot:3439267-Rhodomonas_salina.1